MTEWEFGCVCRALILWGLKGTKEDIECVTTIIADMVQERRKLSG